MSDDWTYSEEPASSLHIGPCDECGRLREQQVALAHLFMDSVFERPDRDALIARWNESAHPDAKIIARG